MTTDAPAETEAPFPAAGVRWAAVGILMLLYALAFIDRQIVSMMVDPIKADLGISDLQIGMLQGFAFAMLYSVVGLPLGMMVDRYPRRRIIAGGVFVWAIAATACGFAANFGQLLTARALVGVGEAALAPAAYSMIGDLFPKKKLTLALGVYTMGAQFGASSSMAISGLILQHLGAGASLPGLGHLPAWRLAFLVTGMPGLLLCLLVFVVPEPVRRARSAIVGRWGEVLGFMWRHARFFAAHFVGFSCMMALAYSGLAWMPTFLIRHFHWPVASVGVALGSFTLVIGSLSLVGTGALVDWLQRRGMGDAHFRVYVVGCVVVTVCGAAAWQAPNAALFFALYIPAFVPLGMAAVAASAIQIVTPPSYRGRVSAIYLLVVALVGMTIGPGLVGLFSARLFASDQMIHWSLSLAFLILAPIGGLAFALGLRPMRDAVAAAQSAT